MSFPEEGLGRDFSSVCTWPPVLNPPKNVSKDALVRKWQEAQDDQNTSERCSHPPGGDMPVIFSLGWGWMRPSHRFISTLGSVTILSICLHLWKILLGFVSISRIQHYWCFDLLCIFKCKEHANNNNKKNLVTVNLVGCFCDLFFNVFSFLIRSSIMRSWHAFHLKYSWGKWHKW